MQWVFPKEIPLVSFLILVTLFVSLPVLFFFHEKILCNKGRVLLMFCVESLPCLSLFIFKPDIQTCLVHSFWTVSPFHLFFPVSCNFSFLLLCCTVIFLVILVLLFCILSTWCFSLPLPIKIKEFLGNPFSRLNPLFRSIWRMF